jgi:predicted hydrocarbon binding protein
MEKAEDSPAEELNRLLGRLFRGSSYDQHTGVFRVENHRVVLVFSDTLVTTQKKMESLMGHDAASMIIYESYREAGLAIADLTQKSAKTEKMRLDEKITLALNVSKMLFWGNWEVREFDRQKTLLIARDSPFAEAYGKSERPVCHPLRGICAGFAEYATGQRRECVEILCKAKGDEDCEFIVAAPENMTELALGRSKRR